MKRYILILFFPCIVASAQSGGVPFQINPNPGGSPFPPGSQPSLTHTAKVFWITINGLSTEVTINAKGSRPTQFYCSKFVNGQQECVRSVISPNCQYHVFLSSAKSSLPDTVGKIVVDGQGLIDVRVYGFKNTDFDNAPIISVCYMMNGTVVGETKVIAHQTSVNENKAKQPAQNDGLDGTVP